MDFRTRLEQQPKNRPISEVPSETLIEEHSACPYFGADRNNAPACLELRLRDGKRCALPYTFFTELSFEPDKGIDILTNTKRICITGRNLTQLYEYLASYRVRFVQVNLGNDSCEDGVFVAKVTIESLI